jgi:cell division initiation protein
MENILPVDIANRKFPRGFRGYSRREVEAFREQVAAALEEVLTENKRLRQEAEELQKQLQGYRSMEDTLKDALVLAERSAEERREQALREAQSVLDRARREGEDIVREARSQVERYREESEHLVRLRARFEAEFVGLLATYQQMLQGNGHSEQRAEPPEPENVPVQTDAAADTG